jgi:hypothetical protein
LGKSIDDLVGPDGLDAEQAGIGKAFREIHEGRDKQLVAQIAIITLLLYFAILFMYFFGPASLVIASLITLYILSIIEVFLACFFLEEEQPYLAHRGSTYEVAA